MKWVKPCSNYCEKNIDSRHIFPPQAVARNSFIQLSKRRHHGENENAQAQKWQKRRFEPGHSRLRVQQSNNELPRSNEEVNMKY